MGQKSLAACDGAGTNVLYEAPRESLEVAAKHSGDNNVFRERERVAGVLGLSCFNSARACPVTEESQVAISPVNVLQLGKTRASRPEGEDEEEEVKSTFGARQPICRLEQGHLVCHSQPFE